MVKLIIEETELRKVRHRVFGFILSPRPGTLEDLSHALGGTLDLLLTASNHPIFLSEWSMYL